MSDVNYWPRLAAQLTALKQQYPGKSDCHVTANGRTPRVVEVSLDNAARLLVDATHRLSSEAEISEHAKEQELRHAQQAQNSGGLDAARRLFSALQPGAKSR